MQFQNVLSGNNEEVYAVCIEQGYGTMLFNKSVINTELRCGKKEFKSGLGIHLPSRVRIYSTKPVKKFQAYCGPSCNRDTEANIQHVKPQDYAVEVQGKKIASAEKIAFGKYKKIEVEFPKDTYSFDLTAKAVSQHYGHALWGDPVITFADGSTKRLTGTGANFLPGNFVSFMLGKKSSELFFAENPIRCTSRKTKDATIHTFQADDGSLRVTVELTKWKDFPVNEWHTYFENIGKKRTARISKIRTADFRFICENGSIPVLTRFHGSTQEQKAGRSWSEGFLKGYRRVDQDLSANEKIAFGAVDGRASMEWLPMLDFTLGEKNLRMVTGWSGQWCSEVEKKQSMMTFRSGLECFDAYLNPGEKIITPSIFVQFTEKGGLEKAVNIWRRFVTQKVMMPLEGKTPKAPICISHWGGSYEKEIIERSISLEKNGLTPEVCWVDAGWYTEPGGDTFSPNWWQNVGEWKFCKTTYPQEMQNLSKVLNKQGVKLLLWFESERAVKKLKVVKEHPDWFLSSGDDSISVLVNYGNPEAWKHYMDIFCGIIERNHIQWFREDFNTNPLKFWKSGDQPGRSGITEVKFMEGLYRSWKTLRTKFPDLMIDNCASGGRRLDIELLRYSIPLWVSDMQCAPEFDPDYAVLQCTGVAHYIPRFTAGTQNARGGDTYNFRAAMNAGICIHLWFDKKNNVHPKYPVEWLKKRIAEYQKIRDCFTGDLYVLSKPAPVKNGLWFINQYDLPEEKRGAVLAFRPKESNVVACQIVLRGLVPGKNYRVSDTDGLFKPFTATGKELMSKGFTITTKGPYSSDIISYIQK